MFRVRVFLCDRIVCVTLQSLVDSVSTAGGNVDSQTANRTEEELSKVEGNQTLRESPANSKTFSFFYE